MRYSVIDVKPVSPHIGADVSGIDLTRPLGLRQVDEISRALAEHQVLFFRDQRLKPDGQKALARHFGDLYASAAPSIPEDHAEALPLHAAAGTTRAAGHLWRSDVSCDERPPLGSIQYLHTVPRDGGDTLFASMQAAYEMLSAPMKAFLGGLTATHAGGSAYRRTNAAMGGAHRGAARGGVSHPVVRTHPVTGRKALFVNARFTTHFDGLPESESRALLAFLFAHATQPAFQVRFRWTPHSVAFWDNCSVQHVALQGVVPDAQCGYRVAIKGDRPIPDAARAWPCGALPIRHQRAMPAAWIP